MKTYPIKRALPTILLLVAAFFVGQTIARGVEANRENKLVTIGRQNQNSQIKDAEATGSNAVVTGVVNQETQNWGLGFGEPGSKPTGNTDIATLKKQNAYFMAEGDEKVLYLTFDCGYENGNTQAILDALKNHNAPATFFVVGHFLESAPELVKQMAEDGHTVGNHTYHHPDMTKITSKEEFCKETDSVREKYKEITGQDMVMYYRPPQGKYSKENLKLAQELGYATFFWSLAYVDWNADKQPSHEQAFDKLTKRVHPGAIVLLHNTSKTNGEILDELLSKWEEMGYSFRPLSDFVEESKQQ